MSNHCYLFFNCCKLLIRVSSTEIKEFSVLSTPSDVVSDMNVVQYSSLNHLLPTKQMRKQQKLSFSYSILLNFFFACFCINLYYSNGKVRDFILTNGPLIEEIK